MNSIDLYQVIYEEQGAAERPKAHTSITTGGKILEVDIRVLAASVIEAAQIVEESNQGLPDRTITYVRKISHISEMMESRYRVVAKEAAK